MANNEKKERKEKMKVMDDMNPACIRKKEYVEFSFSGRVLK